MKMDKTKSIFLMFSFVALLVLSFAVNVSAFRDVECGWGDSVCTENELDDEFDQIEDDYQAADDELQNQINDLEVIVYWNGKLDKMQSKQLDRLKAENKFQWRVIRKNGQDINVLESDVADLKDYLSANEAAYLKDTKGVGFSAMVRYLQNNFLESLKKMFVPISVFNEANDRLFVVEAKLHFMEQGLLYSDSMLDDYVAYLKAKANGESSFVTSGYRCTTFDQVCIKIV